MPDHRTIARNILGMGLAGTGTLSPKEAGFLGQMAFDANPPTDKQARWLGDLAKRHSKGGNA